MKTSGYVSSKLADSSTAFQRELEGVQYTMQRLGEIQAKMASCMDECLHEFRELFPNPTAAAAEAVEGDEPQDAVQQVQEYAPTRNPRLVGRDPEHPATARDEWDEALSDAVKDLPRMFNKDGGY